MEQLNTYFAMVTVVVMVLDSKTYGPNPSKFDNLTKFHNVDKIFPILTKFYNFD